MDDALYRLHAELEETYWWWVAKNRIILSLIRRYWLCPRHCTLSASEGFLPAGKQSDDQAHAPLAGAQGAVKPRALDVGCGAGGILARLSAAPFAFDAVGVDMSPIARDYCARRGLHALDGSLPDNLPFQDPDSFDVIVMSEVVEHVKEDFASVAAAARLLRPGGLLVCTVPAHMWLWSSHDEFNLHQRRYTRAQFGALFDGLGLERLVLSQYQMASLPLIVASRGAERLRTRLTGRAPKEPVVRPLPGPVNWMLTKAFEAEKHWLPRARLPWGTSIIGVYRRPVAGS